MNVIDDNELVYLDENNNIDEIIGMVWQSFFFN
jgi:hypothetical protein